MSCSCCTYGQNKAAHHRCAAARVSKGREVVDQGQLLPYPLAVMPVWVKNTRRLLAQANKGSAGGSLS
jgi:hypothetical protein